MRLRHLLNKLCCSYAASRMVLYVGMLQQQVFRGVASWEHCLSLRCSNVIGMLQKSALFVLTSKCELDNCCSQLCSQSSACWCLIK